MPPQPTLEPEERAERDRDRPSRKGKDADVPTEYTPALLVEAQKRFLSYVHTRLGEHVFRVLQEMRTDAEAFARSEKRSAKDTLGQLLGEVEAWRHLPVGEGSSDTVLDQETEAALRAVPDLMKAVESCIVAGAMVLSGAKGSGNEPVTVRIPSARDFLDRVFVRITKSYTGRGGPSRLAHQLRGGKHLLQAEVREAIDQFLVPYETVWNADDEEAVVEIPVAAPADPVSGAAGANVRTITLDGAQQGVQGQQTPGPARQGRVDKDDDGSGSDSGSDDGSGSDDSGSDDSGSDGSEQERKPRALDDDGF